MTPTLARRVAGEVYVQNHPDRGQDAILPLCSTIPQARDKTKERLGGDAEDIEPEEND